MSRKKLQGQVALITGASKGLGFETSLILAKNGAHILAAGRNIKDLETLSDTIKALSGSCTLIPIDLEKPKCLLIVTLSLVDEPCAVGTMNWRGKKTLKTGVRHVLRRWGGG